MEFKDLIRTRRLAIGKTLEQVGECVGVSKATVQRWESGEIQNLRRDKIAKLAEALDTTPAYLMGWKEDPSPSTNAVVIPKGCLPLPRTVRRPVVGGIACGTPILAEQNIEGYVDVPEDVRADFVLRCVGDSMIDAGIRDGDLVYIRIQPEVENGEIAAVLIGEEATLKKVFLSPDNIMLVPANSSYAPQVYVGSQMDEIRIEGKAVGFFHVI